MALRDLEAEEMIAISEAWVDPARDLPVLEAEEMLAAPVRLITDAHTNLVNMQQTLGASEKRVRELTHELTKLDARHDRKARGIYNALEAGIDLAETPEQAEPYRELRDTLFPQGLQITKKTYRAQAGAAKKVGEHLSDEQRDFLTTIVFGQRTLLDETVDWLATGALIGRRLDERTRLVGDEDDEAVSADDLRHARLDWIKATNALLNMLEFTELDEDEQDDLLANLRDAEKAAVERRLASEDADSPETDDVDTPDVPEPV